MSGDGCKRAFCRVLVKQAGEFPVDPAGNRVFDHRTQATPGIRTFRTALAIKLMCSLVGNADSLGTMQINQGPGDLVHVLSGDGDLN